MDNFDELDEFAKKFLQIAENIIANEKDDDYVVNQPQANALVKVNLFMSKFIHAELGEWVVANVSSPKERHAQVLVHGWGLDLSREDVKEFFSVLEEASSSVSFCPKTDGSMDIDIKIPNVFIKKGTA